MWLLLGCLAVFVVAVVASSAVVFVRARELLRAFRGFSAAANSALEPVLAGTARLSEAPTPAGVSPSLARLRVSYARLSVLLAALSDVRAAVGRITGVVPRK